MKKSIIAVCLILLTGSVFGNDSAVEISAGGLKLRKEHSVLMEREKLYISRDIVRVEYEFRNTSNKTIVSEIAFPIPLYNFRFDEEETAPDFSDFKAWVDGKPIKVRKEVRAFVGEREITSKLKRAGITIEKFGNFLPGEQKGEIQELKPEVLSELIKIGAIKALNNDSIDIWPEWTVSVKYYWKQKFPPGSSVRIKHEYHPMCGFSYYKIQDIATDIKDSCIGSNVIQEVEHRVAEAMKKNPRDVNNYYYAFWVSYILTTANSWQTPIKDFEMTVECKNDEIAIFCWDGPVEKIDGTQYRAHKTDFVPSKELKIYFANSL